MGSPCGSGLLDSSELQHDPKLQVTVTTALSPAARQLLTFPNRNFPCRVLDPSFPFWGIGSRHSTCSCQYV